MYLKQAHKHELVRKAVHALLAITIAYVGLHWGALTIYISVIFLFFLFAYVRTENKARMLYAVPRVSYGEFFFLVGVAAAAALSLPSNPLAWQTAMIVLAFADPLAALIGTRFGERTYRVHGEKRSVEGTGACFVASMGVFVAMGAALPYAFGAGVILAGVEALAIRGSDNALLPIVAALLSSAVF